MIADPLAKLPDQERALFEKFKQAAAGHNVDAVLGACMNIVINAIRQQEPNRSDAEAKLSELVGRTAKLLLDNHYDSVTGRRRSVFPFTQVLGAPFVPSDDGIHG